MSDIDDPALTTELRSVGDSIAPDANFNALMKAIAQDRRRRRAVAATATAAVIAAVAISAAILLPAPSRSVNVAAGGDTSNSSTPAPAELAITIDVDTRTYVGGRSNLVAGTLRADLGRRCLYLETEGGRLHLVFPAGSTIAYDPLRVLEADGSEFALVDQPASFGGSTADDPAPIPETATGCGATHSIHVWRG